MVERVDLDAAERDAASLKRYAEGSGWDDVAEFAGKALVMVAELRDAREIVEAARYADADAPDPWRMSSAAMNDLRAAISSYDQHADSSTHDRSGGS